jgi:glycosyltransferase involved in cell wall biosynthesis
MSIRKNSLRIKNCNLNSKKSKTLITIITVVFNGERFIEDTILSVINQTYQNIEYIIIDGGSNDHTLDIIKKYDYGIDYWISESDEGIYDAMNKGINFATGSWINFMNAGDIFCASNVLEKIVIYSDDIDIIFGDTLVFDSNRKKKIYCRAKKFNISNLLIWQTRTVCHQSMFVRADKIGIFSLDYKLKSEFNQYFLYLNLKSRNINATICQYLTGGISELDFKTETIETFKVILRNKPFLVWISLPIIIYRFYSFFKKKIIQSVT